MKFKRVQSVSSSANTPEELFNDLKFKRTIPGLLSQQADVLRDYFNNALQSSDVAIQLPTGSGKTLVGLLIGEWRRRKYGQRVVYLCPTNQLVYQVTEQATTKYGIEVKPFVGSKSNYDTVSQNEYETAETIAVTSYSGLFNSKPYFSNPNVLILDDAHAAENYIASNWTIEINRYDEQQKSLFTALTLILKNALPLNVTNRFSTEQQSDWDSKWVDKLPTPTFFKLHEDILKVIDEHAKDSDIKYRWPLLRDNLLSCHFYLSNDSFIIRPLIPPANTHEPFSNAIQRVYMSATLGEGGELERLSGRKNILRLKVPEGWDKLGIGRRFFLFPGRSIDAKMIDPLLKYFLEEVDRTLILVPDEKARSAIQQWVEKKLSLTTFTVKQIETTKAEFVNTKKAVAIVANRYDGIDFPGDECRLLMILGLPRGTNLQENFLISRMGAVALYNDRILTRLLQAFGRCTRTPTDYSAVIIIGNELTKYLMAKERRSFLHPEMQAELEFGIQQSKDLSHGDYIDLLRLFLEHSTDWNGAEEQIISLRNELNKETLPGTEDLRDVVNLELDYIYALWSFDYVAAFENARKILGKIKHPHLKGYRALWNYIAGSAAFLATQYSQANLDSSSREYFANAMKSTSSIKWLAELANTIPEYTTIGEGDATSLTLVEKVEILFEKLGTTHDASFDRDEKEIIDSILTNDSNAFESGHLKLGKWLGYDCFKSELEAAPDPYWIADSKICFVFEDYTDTKDSSFICVTKARQVSSHSNWIKANETLEKGAKIIPVLITSSLTVHKEALHHLNDVLIWPVEDFRTWGKNALAIVRKIRKTFDSIGDIPWRSTAVQAFIDSNITPNELLKYLSKNTAKDILKVVNG